MKTFGMGLLAIALLSGRVSLADEGKCDGKCSTSQGTCAVTASLEKLPKLEYVVGEKSLCCEESAKAIATAEGKPLTYLVGSKKFECPVEAFASLVDQTEKYVATVTKPSTCSRSGITTLAGKAMSCPVQAEDVASKMKKAMDTVAISYKVGDKTCSCPIEAQTLATQKKVKKVFVIGSDETECEQTAKLQLARAKYKAALIVLNESAEKKSETKNEGQ